MKHVYTRKKRKQLAEPEIVNEEPEPEIEEEAPKKRRRWKHKDGTPFDEPSLIVPFGMNITKKQFLADKRYQPVRKGASWNATNKVLYNGWLRIRLTPHTGMNFTILDEMGLTTPVMLMFKRMGIEPTTLSGCNIFKELSYQFLASLELHHEQEQEKSPQTAFITFTLRGKNYKLGIEGVCEALNFDKSKNECRLPIIDTKPLWKAIGSGKGKGREHKLTLIRNPAIRFVAKLLGTYFMGKEEATTVTQMELTLLYYAFPREVRQAIYTPEVEAKYPPTLETNLGYIFTEMLVEKKTRGLEIKREKTDHIGGALTHIFREANYWVCDEKEERGFKRSINQKYLRDIKFLRGDGYCYEYTRVDGVKEAVTLPLPYKLGVDTLKDVMFEVPPSLKIQITKPRSETNTSSTSPHLAILPPFDNGSHQEDFAEGASTEEKLAILTKNQNRAHSQRRTIWSTLQQFVSEIDCTQHTSTSGAAATSAEFDPSL